MKKKKLIRRLQKELNRQATLNARRKQVLQEIAYIHYDTQYCQYCHKLFPDHQKDCLFRLSTED